MSKTQEKCRLVRMEIEDFMRCRLVRIAFGDDPVTEIGGLNGEGKSSVLRAFWALVGGKDACPEEPIRKGAESAQVLGELDNGLVIRRRWTASGKTYLDVQTKDGAAYKKPQEVLDALVGRISFDPLAFKALLPKAQAEALRKISGVDFTLVDAKRRQVFDARTDANRRVAAAKARLDSAPVVEAPDETVSAGALLQEQQARMAEAAAQDGKRRELTEAREEFKRYERHIAETNVRIAKLEEELARERQVLASDLTTLETCRKRGLALKAEVEALVPPNLDEVPAKLKDVDATNEKVRQKKARAALATELAQAEAAAAKLSAEIEAIDTQKAETLAQAAFPVPGLGFGEDGITYNGHPFDQASQAEQIRVSMAMGLALNPKLPVVCIRDGSLLDKRSTALVRQMAKEAGAQVLLEIVGTGGSGITIEDGAVVGAEPAEKGAA
jgi:hypothetical protein